MTKCQFPIWSAAPQPVAFPVSQRYIFPCDESNRTSCGCDIVKCATSFHSGAKQLSMTFVKYGLALLSSGWPAISTLHCRSGEDSIPHPPCEKNINKCACVLQLISGGAYCPSRSRQNMHRKDLWVNGICVLSRLRVGVSPHCLCLQHISTASVPCPFD